LFHEFFRWLQEDLGQNTYGMSWSAQLHGSLNLWNLTEGTHVLTLMFFAGTIWIIDLRMLGLAFRNVPFSRLNDKVLPLTVAAFAVMVGTGVIAFFGRDPMMYYHDIWFRFKMLFLLCASINIFWFHYKVQKTQAEWDNDPSPPFKVKLSGAISMTMWFLIIIFGRFIAYDWYKCDKVEKGSLVYALEECKSALSYLDDVEEDTPIEEDSTESEAPAEDAAPAEEAPADPESSAPAQPAPGQGG
jgi:hypothetical protein